MDQEEGSVGDPVVMSIDKAPKYEAIDDKRHPDYVRCRRLPAPGLRGNTERICMKNREWREYLAEQNRRSRDFANGRGPGNGMDQSRQMPVGVTSN